MKEKGLLTKQMQNKISEWIDEQVKLNGVFEVMDGVAIKLILSQLDDIFGEKIPEPYKSKLAEVINVVFEEKDKEKAIKLVLDFANEKIDIPYLDDDSEKLLFDGVYTILLTILSKVSPE